MSQLRCDECDRLWSTFSAREGDVCGVRISVEECADCKLGGGTFGVTRSCDSMHLHACSLACAERIASMYTHARIWHRGSLSPETEHPNYRAWADKKRAIEAERSGRR